ncbi:MAG TPA: ABC transporter permease [Capsulimonadaceae bacterium]|jgi:hypothetical protein
MSEIQATKGRALSTFAELFFDNPMMDEAKRETRRMMRTSATFGRGGLAVTLGIIVIVYLWLLVQTVLTHEDGTPFFIYVELALVTLAMPGSIYAAISGEREKSTWDALVLTRLTPAQIVAGKLVWRLRLLIAIAVIMLIPVVLCRIGAHRYLASETGVIVSQVMIGLWGIMLSSFGLWVSSITKRSIATLSIIAVTITALLLGLPVLYQMFASMNQAYPQAYRSQGTEDPVFNLMMSVNPFTVLGEMLGFGSMGYNNSGPWRDPSGTTACVVFAALTPMFIIASYRRLTKLGEPGIN